MDLNFFTVWQSGAFLCLQYILHGLTSVLLCIPFTMKIVDSVVSMLWLPKIVSNFHSGYIDCTGSFQTVVDLCYCITGWTDLLPTFYKCYCSETLRFNSSCQPHQQWNKSVPTVLRSTSKENSGNLVFFACGKKYLHKHSSDSLKTFNHLAPFQYSLKRFKIYKHRLHRTLLHYC